MNQLRFRVKRGIEDLTTTPTMNIRWKKNNKNSWSNNHEISLGDIGETDIIRRLHRLGIFRTIQFEFSADADVPLNFADAEADVEVLR